MLAKNFQIDHRYPTLPLRRDLLEHSRLTLDGSASWLKVHINASSLKGQLLIFLAPNGAVPILDRLKHPAISA